MSETKRKAWMQEVLAHPERYHDQLTYMASHVVALVEAVENVDGLAGEIGRHAPSDAPQAPGGTDCTCGDGPGAWEDGAAADQHVAEAVIAWLEGGA